jgi:hypothetical protein
MSISVIGRVLQTGVRKQAGRKLGEEELLAVDGRCPFACSTLFGTEAFKLVGVMASAALALTLVIHA